MKALVAYGSKLGGTAGLAEMIGRALESEGLQVDVRSAKQPGLVSSYDAVVVAGGLYANRWHRDARRFVRRNASALRGRPVWLVASGPLDDRARAGDLPPVKHVVAAAKLVNARGQVTFGGYLAPDAKGFPASSMAKKNAGDWRDPVHVAEFAERVAIDLTTVRPTTPPTEVLPGGTTSVPTDNTSTTEAA